MVDLIWYPTDLEFIDFPTSFGSHEWETDYVDLRGLGEIRRDRPARKNWHPGIPGLDGDHVCGTPEQFLDGDPEYTGPPIVYDADHIPLCCPRRQVTFATGGAYPSAILGRVYRLTARVMAGARPAATVSQVYTLTSRTSSSSRPAATVSQVYTLTGRVTGGAGPASTVSQVYTLTGRVTGGAHPSAIVEEVPAPAALVTGGAYPSSWVSTSVMCPAPHVNCSGSLLGALGYNCLFEYVPLNSDSWKAWPTVPGHVYQLIVESNLGDQGYEIYEGDDCGSLVLIYSSTMTNTPSGHTWTATKTRAYVHWSYIFGTAQRVIIGLHDVT